MGDVVTDKLAPSIWRHAIFSTADVSATFSNSHTGSQSDTDWVQFYLYLYLVPPKLSKMVHPNSLLLLALSPAMAYAALFPKSSKVKVLDASGFKKAMEINVCG